MTAAPVSRQDRLLPSGVPRYVRCYDNGGDTIDRYTVVFTGRYPKTNRQFLYLHMSANPFSPQGVGLNGESPGPPDVSSGRWGGPTIGCKSIFGTRIKWSDLPADCQRAALTDYKELWNLEQHFTPAT